MARRRSSAQRKKDQELGYQLVQPERLDLLFEHWDLHGLGLKAWGGQLSRKRKLKEQSSALVEQEEAKKPRHLIGSEKRK